jgi:asparagine synthase (glutamine-hydrolysing)
MPVFPKRRFQHGAMPAERLGAHLGEAERTYRRRFLALYA